MVEDLVLRIPKGSELTFPEGDGNFEKLRDAHDALEETVLLAINEDGTLKNAKVGYAADTGATDAYAVTISGSYADINALLGVVIVVKINTTNAGAITLAVNGFVATAVKKDHGLTLDHADVVATKVAAFLFNGTDYQLLNPRSRSQANYGVDAGAANAYKIEFADLAALAASRFQMPEALYSGYRASFKASNDNTLTSTFEIKITSPSTSLIGTIKKHNTQELATGDIKSGLIYDVIWDGSFWQLVPRLRSFKQTAIPIPSTDGRLASPPSHGLGGVPDVTHWMFVNKGNASGIAHGYAVGDRVDINAFYSSSAEANRFHVFSTSSVLDMICRTSAADRVIVTKAGTGTVGITAAQLAQDFDLEVYAAITN